MDRSRRSYPSTRRTSRRSSLRYLATALLTTGMVATGGFGTLPDNPITQTFQEEIGENLPDTILDPINSLLDELAVPTIPPQPDSSPNPSLDLIGLFLGDTITGTPISVDTPSATFTLTSSPTSTATRTLTPTLTTTATSTATSTATPTLTPTRICSRPSSAPATTTFFNSSALNVEVYLVDPNCNLTLITVLGPEGTYLRETLIGQLWWFVDSASTRLLADYVVSSANEYVDVSTGAVSLATPTPITPTVTSFNWFTVSNVVLTDDVTESGTSLTLEPGQAFFVYYNYRVYNDPCPGCITQLVTGLNFQGSHGEWCAYDGIPGVSPGTSGSEGTNLYAPEASGTYPVIVAYFWHFSCADALANYPSGTGFQFSRVIGQIIVP